MSDRKRQPPTDVARRATSPQAPNGLLATLKRRWARLDERKLRQITVITVLYLAALGIIGYLPWIIIFSPDRPDTVVASIGTGDREGTFPIPTDGMADTGDLEEGELTEDLTPADAAREDQAPAPPPVTPVEPEQPDIPPALGAGESDDVLDVLADDEKGAAAVAKETPGQRTPFSAAPTGAVASFRKRTGGFATRKGAGKKRALRAGGGSDATERAVQLALKWLKRHQEADGSWAGSSPRYRPAVTGLAVLCFLGAGESETSQKYGNTVRRAVAYLVGKQTSDGTFAGTTNYALGICTMALAEAYVMDGRSDVGRAASRGIEAILQRQCAAGGWDYGLPGSRNDMSVSGWAVMALKSAAVGRIRGAEKAYPKFRKLIDETIGSRVGAWYTSSGGTSSSAPSRVGEAMHAVSMLCRVFLGERRTPVLVRGAEVQAGRLPNWQRRHTYRLYYATLALFQIGGPTWQQWNRHVATMLVRNQRQDDDFAGSWDAGSGLGENAGRAYITSLCCLTLEVYYRYAAIYR